MLFVEPILNAFSDEEEENQRKRENGEVEAAEDEVFDGSRDFKLLKADALYFLLGLACSSNLGSALTYTGNPQVL